MEETLAKGKERLAPSKGRNQAMDLTKGLAILCVVVGHCAAPDFLTRFIYTFHMPLFFMAAGYFFAADRVEADPWRFVTRRFRGLYLPFVKWSLFFLLIHNVLFHFNILNETYGNWEGGVTHPYTWPQAAQRFISIVFSMGGYDEFLCGPFWFFRGLLVASLAFMVMWLLLGRVEALKGHPVSIAVIICLLTWALSLWKAADGWRIVTLVQGGARDIMATFFFSAGFLYRRYEPQLGHSLWRSLVCLCILLMATCFRCSGMVVRPTVQAIFTLPLTGLAGWLMVYDVAYVAVHGNARLRALPGRAWRWLATCGTLSLYIFIWHVSAYKAVSLLKIWWYGLNPLQIGCHMVIHEHCHDDLFWVLYSVAGMAVPIAGHYIYFGLKARVKDLCSKS